MKNLYIPITSACIAILLAGCSSTTPQEKEQKLEDKIPIETIIEKPKPVMNNDIRSPVFMDLKFKTKFNRSEDKLFRFNNVVMPTLEMSYEMVDKTEGEVILKVSRQDDIEYVKKSSKEYENLLICESDYRKDYEQVHKVKNEADSQDYSNGYIIANYGKDHYRIDDSPCARKVYYKEVLIKKKMVKQEYNQYDYSIEVLLQK